MTTLVRIAVAALVAFILSSCNFDINLGSFTSGIAGNRKIVEQSRKITEDFTEVSVSDGLVVYVTQAKDFKIDVEADDNIIDLIATDIKNGKLRIHTRENIGMATKKIYVSLPEVMVLKSSSGAQLQCETLIESDKLTIDGSSGAQIQIELMAGNLDIDTSSGANLTVSGESNRTKVDVSSGGNIDATRLLAKICHADASSGGNLQIKVIEALIADATSGGNIGYSGEPSIQEKKSVSGSVHRY